MEHPPSGLPKDNLMRPRDFALAMLVVCAWLVLAYALGWDLPE